MSSVTHDGSAPTTTRSSSKESTPPIAVLTDTAREILYASLSWFLIFYVVTVVYMLVGALIFQNLELGEERRQAEAMEAQKKILTLNLISLAKQHRHERLKHNNSSNSKAINQKPVMSDELYLQEVKQALHRHAQTVISLSVTTGFDPRFGKERDTVDKWSLAGGLLHASGVISTTGFFNVSPSTLLGRLTTVIYAILGIPLFLMLMTNVGFLLSSSVTLMLRIGLPKLRKHYCIGKLDHPYIRRIRYFLHQYLDSAMQSVSANEKPGNLTHASNQQALAHLSIDQGLSQSEEEVSDTPVNQSVSVKRLFSEHVAQSSSNANHVKRLQNARYLNVTKGHLRSSQDANTNRRFTKHEKQWSTIQGHGMRYSNRSMTTNHDYMKPNNQWATGNCHRSELYAQSDTSRGHSRRSTRGQSRHTIHYLKQHVNKDNLDDRYPFIAYWEPKGSRNIHSHRPAIKGRRMAIPVSENVEAGTSVDTGLRPIEGIAETELTGLFLWKKDRTCLDIRENLGRIDSCLVHTPAGLLYHNAEDHMNILHAGYHLPDFADFLAPADLFVCQKCHICRLCYPPSPEQLFNQETMSLLQYRFPEMAISVAALIVYILLASLYFWSTPAQGGYLLYQEALYFCVASIATTGANGVDLPMNTSPRKFRTVDILIFQFLGLALLATCLQPGPYPRVLFVGANQHYRLRDLQEDKGTHERSTTNSSPNPACVEEPTLNVAEMDFAKCDQGRDIP